MGRILGKGGLSLYRKIGPVEEEKEDLWEGKKDNQKRDSSMKQTEKGGRGGKK